MSYKMIIDQNSATNLVTQIKKTTNEIETDTKTMLESFIKLHDFFKDEDYDTHSTNIVAAISSMKETCQSLNDMAKALDDYSKKIFG